MSKDMGKSKGIKQNKIHEILLFRQFRKKIWFYSYGFNMCRNLALGDTVIFEVSRRFYIRKNSMGHAVLLKIWKKL